MLRRSLLAVSLSLVATGCEMSPSEKLLVIDSTGTLASLLYLDRDGDALPSQGDLAAAEVSFAVVRGMADTVATGTTDEEGVGVVSDLPVGSYRVLVDAGALGDSLELADVATAVVEAGDTSGIFVPLQYPSRTVRGVAEMDEGVVVAVEAVALNGWATFGDSTVHVADSTGALRAVRVPAAPVAAGDSLRIVGRTSLLNGEIVLGGVVLYLRGKGKLPEPVALNTASASNADGGRRGAALVSIADARVVDVIRLSTGDYQVSVDDGSGMLEVLLDRYTGIVLEAPLVPGVRLSATGLLVAGGSGGWRLKPRSTADVEVRVPSATVAEARAMPLGQIVSIVGVALNGWRTFGDGSVHLADATGSVRVSHTATSFVAAGDSISVVGVVARADEQPVIASSELLIVKRDASDPVPTEVSAASAASADGGALDAALVLVKDVVVDTAVAAPGHTYLILTEDGEGLIVALDPDTGIRASVYGPGDRLDVVGVLVPRAGGKYLLKPRNEDDVTVR